MKMDIKKKSSYILLIFYSQWDLDVQNVHIHLLVIYLPVQWQLKIQKW